MKELKFSDDVIANIAKVLQIAIITGTDIVDNLKLIKLTESEQGVLDIHEDFKNQLENNIESLFAEMELSNKLDDTQA